MAIMREICEHGTLIRQHSDYQGPEDAQKVRECPPHCKFNVAQEVRYTFVVTVVPQSGDYEVFMTSQGEKYIHSKHRVKGEGWMSDPLHPMDVMDALRDEIGSHDSTGSKGKIQDRLWRVKSIKMAQRQEPEPGEIIIKNSWVER